MSLTPKKIAPLWQVRWTRERWTSSGVQFRLFHRQHRAERFAQFMIGRGALVELSVAAAPIEWELVPLDGPSSADLIWAAITKAREEFGHDLTVQQLVEITGWSQSTIYRHLQRRREANGTEAPRPARSAPAGPPRLIWAAIEEARAQHGPDLTAKQLVEITGWSKSAIYRALQRRREEVEAGAEAVDEAKAKAPRPSWMPAEPPS